MLAAIERCPDAPEEIARRIDVDLFTVRPVFSMLKKEGLIKETGLTKPSRTGRRAMIYRKRHELEDENDGQD